MTFDLLDQYTVLADGSGVTPTTADQVLVTITVPEQKSHKYYWVHFEIEAAMVTTPVVQQLDLEILNDTTIVKTFNYSPGATDVVGIHQLGFQHLVAKNTGGTIVLRLGNAGAADVDTTIKVKNVVVAGVS
jgi:hypothetical protein